MGANAANSNAAAQNNASSYSIDEDALYAVLKLIVADELDIDSSKASAASAFVLYSEAAGKVFSLSGHPLHFHAELKAALLALEKNPSLYGRIDSYSSDLQRGAKDPVDRILQLSGQETLSIELDFNKNEPAIIYARKPSHPVKLSISDQDGSRICAEESDSNSPALCIWEVDHLTSHTISITALTSHTTQVQLISN